MIKVGEYEILNNNKSTLKDTSIDSANNEYMTESDIEVIDFDEVAKKYKVLRGITDLPTSNDALFIGENEIFFIEFKNGQIDANNIRLKICDSMWMLTDIIEQNISYMRENVKYILVYNSQKKQRNIRISASREDIKRRFTKKGKDNLVSFGLKRLEKFYINEAFTYTKDDFEEEFVKKYS